MLAQVSRWRARPAGAGGGRARHRQGAGGGAAHLPLAALGPALRQAQLRRARREPARQRAVRPRGRRLHRRHAPPRCRASRSPMAARSSSTRSPPPRWRCRRRSCASSSTAASSGSAATRRCASMCASSPPPTSICRRSRGEGRFRSDLLDRLAFDVVTIPPLRERPRGHPAARRAFRAAPWRASWGASVFAGFTADAVARLVAYRWPGNVRELKNVVERSRASLAASGRSRSTRSSSTPSPRRIGCRCGRRQQDRPPPVHAGTGSPAAVASEQRRPAISSSVARLRGKAAGRGAGGEPVQPAPHGAGARSHLSPAAPPPEKARSARRALSAVSLRRRAPLRYNPPQIPHSADRRSRWPPTSTSM